MFVSNSERAKVGKKMKNINWLFIILCGVFVSMSAYACKHIDQVTMGVATKGMKSGHPIVSPAREIVLEYMLKNGDITLAEINQRKSEKDALRAELRALKESGDKKAFKTRLEQLKKEHHARRAEFEAYVENNAELKAKLMKQKDRGKRGGGDRHERFKSKQKRYEHEEK